MILRFKSRKRIYLRFFIIISFIICVLITILQLPKVVESENFGSQLELVGMEIKHSVKSDFNLWGGRIESEEHLFKGVANFNNTVNSALIQSLGIEDGIVNSNAIITFVSKILNIQDEILIIVIDDVSFSNILFRQSIKEIDGSLYLYRDINRQIIQKNSTTFENEIILNISSTQSRVEIIENMSLTKIDQFPNIIQSYISENVFDHYILTSKMLAESFKFTIDNFLEFCGDFNVNRDVYSKILFSRKSEEILEDIKIALGKKLQSDYIIDITIKGYIYAVSDNLRILKQISFAQIKFLQFFIIILCFSVFISSFNVLESSRIRNEQLFVKYSSILHRISDIMFDSVIILFPAIMFGILLSNTLLYFEEHIFNLSNVLFPSNVLVLPIIIIIVVLVLVLYALINIGMLKTKTFPDFYYEKKSVLNPFLLTIVVSSAVIGIIFFDEFFLSQLSLIMIIILLTVSIVVIFRFLSKILFMIFQKIWVEWQFPLLKDFFLLLKLWKQTYLRKGYQVAIITSILCSLFIITTFTIKELEVSNDTSEGVPIYISEKNTLNLSFNNELFNQPEIKNVMPVIYTSSSKTSFNVSNSPFINRGLYLGIKNDQILDFYGSEVEQWGNNIDAVMRDFTGILIPENEYTYPIGTILDIYFHNNSLNSVDSIQLEVQGHITRWSGQDNVENTFILPIEILYRILIDSGEEFETKYLIQPVNDPVKTIKNLEGIVGFREIHTIDLKYYTLINYSMKIPLSITAHCILIIITCELIFSENSQGYARSKESRIIAKLSLSKNSTNTFIKIKSMEFLFLVTSILLTVITLVAISIIFILETTSYMTNVYSYIDSSVRLLTNNIYFILIFITLLIVLQILIDIIRFKREFNIDLSVRHYE